MLNRSIKTLLMIMLAAVLASAQGAQRGTDTVLVLPFENISDKPEFNWVGESFALSLSELLNVPGIHIITNSERKIVQQRLRIPLTSIPSLATSLRLSRESGATLLVTGTYNILPAQEDSGTATINVTARIIRVNEGRFLSEELPNGRRITRDIALHDALGNLQTVQGQIAYNVLYQRDKALPYSQNQMIEAASKVPAKAFEAYIKGLLTSTTEIRENYFKNAMRLYTEANPEGTFADAALELGHLYLNQRRHNEAIEAFERVAFANKQCHERAKADNRVSQCNDESYAESSFYTGVIRWQQGNYEQALSVLRPLADDLKITSVYNMLGAIAVQASSAEKKDQTRVAALLNEGLELLKKAAEASPDDRSVRFNYAMALFLHADYHAAVDAFRAVITATPGDGEAHYVLSKSLADLKDPAAADIDNKARTLLTAGNRYANLERDWLKSKAVDIEMRVEQPQRKDFVSVVLSRRDAVPVQTAVSGTENLLAQARTHYKNGNDDEAMAVLRRVLVSEPMSAESYLILGKIHLRRGDREPAISSLKTALFWDNRQIDAHILLGRIYLERGDCQQAKTFAASALEIDANSPEANGLQRQTERCSK